MKKFLVSLLIGTVPLGSVGPAIAASVMEKVMSEKRLVVGTAPWNKMTLRNPQTGVYEGYAADDLRNFEALTGIKIEYADTGMSGLVAGLQAGKWDVITFPLSATPQRAATVAFTEPIGYMAVTALVRPDNKAQSVADLDKAGNTITVNAGGITQEFARRKFKNATIAPLSDSGASAMLELMQGKSTAYLTESVTSALREAELSGKVRSLNFPKNEVEWTGVGYVVRYGEPDLLKFLDTYIKAMKLRGWYTQLGVKWNFPASFAAGPGN